jgi:predicted component of type VI protein secretion system
VEAPGSRQSGELTLLVREASGTERVVPAGAAAAPLTIGRDAECAVRIDSPYVSRTHARIEWQDGAPIVVDLGSRNGSLLNGERVQGSAPLNDGDAIAIGDATIRCHLSQTPSTRTLEFHGAGAAPMAPAEVSPASADRLHVNASTYEVSIGEEQLARRLSAQEFQLLSYLYEHRQRVCTRQELGDAIWGRDLWDVNMLHRLVHRLKEKLEPAPAKPRYVQTVPWVGYRLTP